MLGRGLFSGCVTTAILLAVPRLSAAEMAPHPRTAPPQSALALYPFLFNWTALVIGSLAVAILACWALSMAWSANPAAALPVLSLMFGGTARRRLARSVARSCRRALVWISSSWRAFLLVYLAAAVLLALQHILTAKDPAATAKWLFAHTFAQSVLIALHWFLRSGAGPWLQAFALAAVLCLVPAAFRARRRIVIAAFVNATGDSTRAAAADGLARRLMAELGEIREIYQDVSDDPSDLSVNQRDILELTVDAASAFADLTASFKGQQVEVWGFKIPLDWAVTTLSALVRGPQIKGSVQNTADGLMFEASLTGGGYDLAWRVTAADIDVPADEDATNPQAAAAEIMVRQLAYRIFASLSQDQVGTASWRAAQQYTQALRAFRGTKRDTARRPFLLQQAQQGFFQAYRHDNRFVRSRYNLGVILYSQQQYEAAYEVFKRVINDCANTPPAGTSRADANARWRGFLSSAHYAAAKASQGIKDMKPAVGLDDAENAREAQCRAQFRDRMAYHIENAIQLNPRDARAWNLQGVILFNAHSAQVNVHPFDVEIRRCANTAAALSWSALCAAELGGKPQGTAAALAALHLANLSQTLGDTPAATRTMAQAIDLVPSNSANWKELGRFYLRQGLSWKALRAFEMANRVEEKPIYWLWIACTRRLLKLDASQFDITAAMQSFGYAWRGAIEDGSDPLFEQYAFTGFWKEWDKSIPDPKTRPDLDDWKKEIEERLALIAGIQNAAAQLSLNSPAGGNAAAPAQIAAAIADWEQRLAHCDPEHAWYKARINLFLCDLRDKAGDETGATRNLEAATALLALDHRGEITARALRTWLAQRALAGVNLEEGSFASQTRLDAVLKKMIAALKQNPNEGYERSLLARLYLAMGCPESAGEQQQNALSLDPTNVEIRRFAIDISSRKFPALRDPKARQAALQRMVFDARNEAAYAENDVWTIDRANLGQVHYWLGIFSLERLDFDTMRSSFETAVACRYKPLECLANLCETHFRSCDPDEGERNYARLQTFLNDLFPGYSKGDARLLECSATFKETLQEEKPPALCLAWAAIFTATAMAEQGLTWTAARARFRIARLWTRQLHLNFKNNPALYNDKSLTGDDLSNLDAGISLCIGAIFRSAARQAFDAAGNRVWFLTQAIRRFNRALELTTGANSTMRPDALYRKAGACAELALSEPANAEQARTLATEAATLAQIADLRGEYKSRLEKFMQTLGTIPASGSPAKTTFLPKDQPVAAPKTPPASPPPPLAPPPPSEPSSHGNQ